jgi:hypothetical protein
MHQSVAFHVLLSLELLGSLDNAFLLLGDMAQAVGH